MKRINKISYSVIVLVLAVLFNTMSVFAAPSLVPVPKSTPTTISAIKYNVDTLAKSVSRCRHLVVDNNNTVYYIEFYNNITNKLISVTNGVKTIMADGGNEVGRELNFTNLVFDQASDRVLLLCNFNSEYFQNNEFEGNSLVYDIKDLSTPIAIFQEGSFTSDDKPVIDGNTIIDNGLVFDLDESMATVYSGDFNSTYAAFINDQFISYDNGTFNTYDLSSDNSIKIPVTLTGMKSLDAITSFNNKFYLYSLGNRSFYEVDTTIAKPKATLYTSSADITVKDRFPFGDVSEFTFCNDGSIIFYDATNKALRRMTVASTPTTTTPTTTTPTTTPKPSTTPTPNIQDINIITTKTDSKGGKQDSIKNYKFVIDDKAIGEWDTIGVIEKIDSFDASKLNIKKDPKSFKYNFYKDGSLVYYTDKSLKSGKYIWSKGFIVQPDNIIPAYSINTINGKTFMFIQMKNGDYTLRGKTPWYYVLIKTSNIPDSDFTPVEPNATFIINGVKVKLPGSIEGSNAKLNTTIDENGNRHDNLDYKFTLDKDAVGEWQFFNGYTDITRQFDPTAAPSPNSTNWTGNSIYVDGTMIRHDVEDDKPIDSSVTWTKGYLMNDLSGQTIPAYSINTINGKTFMIIQWKSGDYVAAGAINSYCVFMKTSDTPAPAPEIQTIQDK